VGMLASDGALFQTPVSEAKQAQAAVFCSLLANLVELKRDANGQNPAPFRARHPRAIARSEVVSRAVELIRRESSLNRNELARRLGTSSSRLGKAFKSEMGFSVRDYRNRLRLETFLGLVDRGGANLMQAALDAGFGSYAQFHRVFRSLLGSTPREYLVGRKEG
jgi:AraC-like DNA-binding protein